MKVLGVLLLMVVGMVTIGHLLPPLHAASVEAAGATLSKTEQQLRTTVADASTTAGKVREELANPQRTTSLSQDVAAFLNTTHELASLRDQLTKDVDAYDTAYAAKIEAMGHEIAAITDPDARRAMEAVRKTAGQECLARIASTRTTLALLDHVLVAGTDVQHAAKVVMIADELQHNSNQLLTRANEAAQQARAYEQLTASLLAQLKNHAE